MAQGGLSKMIIYGMIAFTLIYFVFFYCPSCDSSWINGNGNGNGNGPTSPLCEYPINYYYFTGIQGAQVSADEWGVDGVHTHEDKGTHVLKWTTVWSEEEGRTYRQIPSANAYMPGETHEAFEKVYKQKCGSVWVG